MLLMIYLNGYMFDYRKALYREECHEKKAMAGQRTKYTAAHIGPVIVAPLALNSSIKIIVNKCKE